MTHRHRQRGATTAAPPRWAIALGLLLPLALVLLSATNVSPEEVWRDTCTCRIR